MATVNNEKTENGFLKKREIHNIDFSISAVVCFLDQVIQPIQGKRIKLISGGFNACIINGCTLKGGALNFLIEIKPFSWEKGYSVIIRLMKIDSSFNWWLCYIGFRFIDKCDETFRVEHPVCYINFSKVLVEECRTFLTNILKN